MLCGGDKNEPKPELSVALRRSIMKQCITTVGTELQIATEDEPKLEEWAEVRTWYVYTVLTFTKLVRLGPLIWSCSACESYFAIRSLSNSGDDSDLFFLYRDLKR